MKGLASRRMEGVVKVMAVEEERKALGVMHGGRSCEGWW